MRGADGYPDSQTLGPARLELGEGGRWDGSVFWQVDLLAGRLFRAISPWNTMDLVLDADQPLGCVVPAVDGFLALAGRGVAEVRRLGSSDASLRMLCEPAPPGHRINDGAVCDGRLFFGTMDTDGTAGRGALWRLDSDGVVTQLLDGLGCPNGPAFDRNRACMYLVDSTARVIYRHDLQSDGTIGAAETFADFPIGQGTPDGLLVDADGRVWVAMWDGAAVRRFRPDGSPDATIPLPVRRPTSVTAVPDALLVTSARSGLRHPDPLDGATLVLPIQVSPPDVQRCAIPHHEGESHR